jgi:hypothetical protein
MRISWRFPVAGILMALACAHAPVPPVPEDDLSKTTPEKIFVTGSHIAQRVDPASGEVRSTSPIRIYSRERILETGRQYDLRSALGRLDPSLSP